MHFSSLLMTVFIACAFAVPLNPAGSALGRRDRDEDVVYPDEKFYAEEYKRSAHDADEDIVYPDEKFYAEEY